MRRCCECKEELPKGRKCGYCSQCMRLRYLDYKRTISGSAARKRAEVRYKKDKVGLRRCYICNIEKEEKEFRAGASHCKSCQSIHRRNYQARYRKTSPKAILNRRRYSKLYDNQATPEEVARFEIDCVAQKNICPICKRVGMFKKKEGLVYDHDHKTGRYRGAICHDCNVLLGRAHDDITILECAIYYLGSKHA